MKQIAIVFAALMFVAGCAQQPEGEQSDTQQKQDVKQASAESQSFSVDPKNSVIKWVGSKPGGEHNGTVSLKSGTIEVKEGTIEAGEFVMDMSSIKNLDLEKEDMNKKLVNHLKSDDFFYVEKYPGAKFAITDVEKLSGATQADNGVTPTHKISGNLTMRDTTNNISFNAAVDISDNTVKAESVKFLIDRTNWNVNHMSKSVFDNLKDRFVHDDMALEVVLHAKK